MLKWLRHWAADRREIATARRALAEQRKRLGEEYAAIDIPAFIKSRRTYGVNAEMNYLWAHPDCRCCVHRDQVVHLPIIIPRAHCQPLYCNVRCEYVPQRDPNPAQECMAYYPNKDEYPQAMIRRFNGYVHL